MENRVEFDSLLFSEEASAVISDLLYRLTVFAKINRTEEPEIWGEVEDDGRLNVKMTVKTRSGGVVNSKLEIPPEHWGYSC